MSRLGAATIGLVAALVLSSAPVRGEQTTRPLRDDDVVARVNGSAIQRKAVREVVQGVLAVQDAQPDPGSIGKLADDALDSLIALELLYQEAQARGVTVSDSAVDEEIARSKSRFSDPHAFEEALKAKSMTQEDLRRDTRKTMVVNKFLEAGVWRGLRVTSEQVRDFYEQNKEQFHHPAEIRVSHILIRVRDGASEADWSAARQRATALLEQLKNGADFAVLARAQSEDPGSNSRGGDVGYMAKGDMDEEFEKAAFAIEPGQLSGVVGTRYGFHIIKVTDRRPAGYLPLQEVNERISAVLLRDQRQQKQAELVAQLHGKAKIEYGEK